MNQSSHRNGHRSRQYRSRVRTRIIVGLSLALLVMTIFTVVLSFKLENRGQTLADIRLKEGREARRLAELEPRLAAMEQELAALVQSKLPHLQPLDLDKVFTLKQGYAKNIVFSIAGKRGKGKKLLYEYKLVMDNQALTPVHPHIQILLFDRDGIQVGFSEFGVDKEGVPTLDILEPDETRSQIGQILFTDENEPRYFMVRLKE